MVSSYITRAAAIRILVDAIQKEYFGDLDVTRALKISWSDGLLLPTGAKIVRRPDGWCIHGYAADGRDVFEYIERAHIRRQPYRGEIMTQEAFEAKRKQFDRPLETRVSRITPAIIAAAYPPLPEPPVDQPTSRVTYRFRPARNRPGWERERVVS